MRYKIISRDKETGKYTRWTGDITNLIAFREICQYFLDSIDHLEDFMIMDVNKSGICYDFLGITTEVFGMRKRTFQERLKNITTGIIREV